MPAIYGDATLGRLIFTDQALTNMHKNGLFRFQVLQALRQGDPVKPATPGTLQRQHRQRGRYEISVVYRTITPTGEAIQGAEIVSCWKRRIE